jgi:hypothetical protein
VQTLRVLDRLEEVLETSRRVPLTTRVIVDGDALAAAMADLRGALASQVDDVDAYLRDIANALDDLRPDGEGPPTTPVTAAATAQVQRILESAEATAQQLREQAHDDASRTREAAAHEAECTRADAAAEAAEQLRRVEQAAARLDELVEGTAHEMHSLIEGLRDSGGAVGARFASMLAELEQLGASRPAAAENPSVPLDAAETDGAHAAEPAALPPSPEAPASATSPEHTPHAGDGPAAQHEVGVAADQPVQ